MTEGLTNDRADAGVVLLIIKQLKRCSVDDDLVKMILKQEIFKPTVDKLQADLSVSKEVILFLFMMIYLIIYVGDQLVGEYVRDWSRFDNVNIIRDSDTVEGDHEEEFSDDDEGVGAGGESVPAERGSSAEDGQDGDVVPAGGHTRLQ